MCTFVRDSRIIIIIALTGILSFTNGWTGRPTGPRAPDGPDAPSSAPAAARARAPRVRGAGGGIILVSNRLLGE